MFRIPTNPAGPMAGGRLHLFRRLHGDQRGTISIVSVFALLMFTMLLVMIVNVATHLDDKIKMQNAADAAAYSGGVVLARGMNSLAFTNHLLADVFAITAFLREGRLRTAERLTPEILDEWERTGQKFTAAEFQKFHELGLAITDKVPKERELVGAFGNLTEAAAAYTLPVFESILRDRQIPDFQRAVVRMIPDLAQQATSEVARRHGFRRSERGNLRRGDVRPGERGPQAALLWRMVGIPVGQSNEDDPLTRTLPVVDPDPAESDFQSVPNREQYLSTALTQRRELAKHYLERWTATKLSFFDRDAEMSQFSNLWRIFTCAQLDRLLNEEYPLTNLPMVIRQTETGVNRYLEFTFNFLAIVYRKQLKETGPGVFRNPLSREADAVTFAQVSLFLPRARARLTRGGQRGSCPTVNVGGTYGFDSGIELSLPPEPVDPNRPPTEERWFTENWPHHWDLLNQNWTVKLVPATAQSVPAILGSDPGDELVEFRPPNLGGATIQEFKKINTH